MMPPRDLNALGYTDNELTRLKLQACLMGHLTDDDL
jgi:hypothetical protein